MSDIHVLSGSGSTWRVMMHFAIPNTNNSVAVNYRTALVNSGLGGATGMDEGVGPGQISTAEKAQVESGEVHEHLASFLVESGGTSNAELQASLREFYTQTKNDIIAGLQRKLKYFGHTESEA